MRADLICFVGEEYDTSKDLLLFDPNATWKKTRLEGGTYTMKEILKPVFIRGGMQISLSVCLGNCRILQAGKSNLVG